MQLKGSYISEERYDVERNNPLLRAQLLLSAISDSELLPFRTRPFKVHRDNTGLALSKLTPYSSQITLDVSNATAAAATAATQPPVIHIHTCDTSMEITINSWLQNALREDCSLNDEKVTHFDVWFHTQMLVTGYNRA
jgi:hypothetical protein